MFLRQIESAKNFIYIENQYFASRVIAEAVAHRLQEADPPEIVVIHAHSAHGWFEPTFMDPPRAKLAQAVEELDRNDRFHLYVPYTGDTPIYVHAKLMIVDDRMLRVGSSNFNNRSLGLDSECDVFIDCDRPGNEHAQEGIRKIRYSLLAEHCGLAEEEVGPLLEQHGSMAAMITALAGTRRRSLRIFEPEEPDPFMEEMALREMFDPEHPDELFELLPRRRGLFRSGSLLAKALERVERRFERE